VSLTDRDRKIVIALLPLLLIGIYWFLILSPKRKEATKLATQVTKAQQARDAAVSQANSLEQAKANFASEYSEMVSLGKAIPTQVDMPSLIVQLDSAAHGTGIQFGNISVGARVAAAPAAATTSAPATAPTTTPSTTPTPNVAAGGATATTGLGKDAEAANNQAAASNAQAVQESGLSADDTSTSTSSKAGGLPVGGGTTVNPSVIPAGQPVPGLDTVPLTFTFGGKFGNLANFFHRLKRFVHVANNKISVDGRLITINSLKFTSTAANFPDIEADVTATVYLSPQDGGTTAGATSTGPATTTPGATTTSNAAAATSVVSPPTSAITR
jgi:hypothetical protein